MRGGGYGDLYVQVNTEVPVNLNSKQKNYLKNSEKLKTINLIQVLKILSKSQKFLEKLD